MKSKHPKVILIVLLFTLSAFIPAMALSEQSYTAKTFIKVLPYMDNDPMSIGTINVDREIQKEFRNSLAILMKEQNFLTELIKGKKIKATKWFKSFEEDNSKAIENLQDNFFVSVFDGTDFIEVAMRCSNRQEAALIVNEAVNFFAASQIDKKVERIRLKLVELEERRKSIEQKLDLAQRSLDDVRKSSGFSGLEERKYRHPIEERVIRLAEVVDSLELEIAYVEGLANEKSSDKDVKKKLPGLNSKLQKAKELLERAEMKNHRLDDARRQYQRRTVIRDQLIETLGNIKLLIEKYRILAEDPDLSKVVKMGHAAVPSKPD